MSHDRLSDPLQSRRRRFTRGERFFRSLTDFFRNIHCFTRHWTSVRLIGGILLGLFGRRCALEIIIDRVGVKFIEEIRTTKRFGTYLIFEADVSTFFASCSISIKRFLNDWACPLIEMISSLYCVPFPFVSGGVKDFLETMIVSLTFQVSAIPTFDCP